jgi:putative component of membrane protein insertase Oxa1/YidC/SpoIIIJ protein YidD
MPKMDSLSAAVVIFCFYSSSRPLAGTPVSSGQEPADPIPWEMKESVAVAQVPAPVHCGIAASLELSLIRLYQEQVAPRSIRRCMFGRSCSSFATEAIGERGALCGLLLALDRYFYRENPRSMRLYEWRPTPDRGSRPEDEWFLGRRSPEHGLSCWGKGVGH